MLVVEGLHDRRATRTATILLDRCRRRIFLTRVKNARLNHNSLRNVRDGYYLENVDAAKSDFNYFTGAQYGIHYMYTRDCTATGNRAVGVRGGYALRAATA